VWDFLFYFFNGSRNCFDSVVFFFYFSIGFWNCSDGVVFFGLFFYWILDLFWQCGIFFLIFLMDLGTARRVWYVLFYFSNGSKNCSTVWYFFVLFFYWILELFWQCGIFCFIFLLDLGTVPMVRYFLFYFSIAFWNCSDSVVFFVLFFNWILDLFRQCGIFCFIFLLDIGSVLTVWYFLFYFTNGYRNCSDSVVFFVLFF
jgi:hypothetical protein